MGWVLSSDLVDVIIGVVFAWFLLSLGVSALNEAFAWATHARAKLLWRALGQLFDDGVDAADARLSSLAIELPRGDTDMRPKATTNASKLSDWREKRDRTEPPPAARSQLQGLYEQVNGRVADAAPKNWRTRINHIPIEIVGDAVTSLAAQTVTRGSLLVAAQEVDARLVEAIGALGAGPLDQDEVRASLPDDLHLPFDEVWAAATQIVTVEDLEQVVKDNPALQARIRGAVRGLSENDAVVRARREIERWFEGSMDALSRFYRRQNRKIVAVIAVPIVLLANADVFDMVSRLREDQSLRAASVTAAASWAADPLTRDENGHLDLTKACTRAIDEDEADGSTGGPTTSEPPSTTNDADPIAEARRRFHCAAGLFASSDLIGPLGPRALWREIRASDDSDSVVHDLLSFSYRGVPGRVVTLLALLFGASFWYDALRRLIGLRGKIGGGQPG